MRKVKTKSLKFSESFENLLVAVEENFGKNTIYKPSDFIPKHGLANRLSCGNIELDIALGGGNPRGRIILVSGPPSSGKTYYVLKSFAEHTKKKEKVALIDEEFTFDDDWATKCGIDRDYCWVGQAEYAEKSLDLAEVLIGSGEFQAVGIDSLAALIPQKTLNEAHEDAQMAIEARLVGKFIRKCLKAQNKLFRRGLQPPTIFLVNQIRYKIGVIFGNPETLPTGNAQHFFNSLWIDFRSKEGIMDGKDNEVGLLFKYNIKKNKTAPPRKKGIISMFNQEYQGMCAGDWDNTGAIIDAGTRIGVIIKSGKHYASNLFRKKYMYKQLWEEFRKDPVLENKVLNEIKIYYGNKGMDLTTSGRPE